MEYEEMKAMEKTHVCAQCQSNLVLIWDRQMHAHRLVCSMDHNHQGYQRVLSPGETLARGDIDKIAGRGTQEELENMARQGYPVVSRLPDKDLSTGAVIDRDKLRGLIVWGNKLGLKPYLGHVCLYFGKPYVTIDGYYYLNGKQEQPFVIGTRPATKAERQTYQVGEEDRFWIAEAWLEGEKLATQGFGMVTKDEVEGKSVKHPEQFRAPIVHSHPQRMAEKRAEWQLLRKLIPLEEQE